MSTNASPWQIFVSQMQPAAVARPKVNVLRASNPRPRDGIRPVSASRTTLEFFKANPGRYFSRWALIQSTGCTEKSIDWACRYLIAQGLIEAASSDTRSPRYSQYRLLNVRNTKAVLPGPVMQPGQEHVANDALQVPKNKPQRICPPPRSASSLGPTKGAQTLATPAIPAVDTKSNAFSDLTGKDELLQKVQLPLDTASYTDGTPNLWQLSKFPWPDDDGNLLSAQSSQEIPT